MRITKLSHNKSTEKDNPELLIRKSAKRLEIIVYGLIIIVTIAIMLIVYNLILMS